MSDANIDHDDAAAQLDELIARRRVPAARDVLARALPHYPDSPVLLQQSAWVDWLDDDLEASEATVRKVLQIEPDSYSARMLLVRILDEREDFQKAEDVVLNVLSDYPEEPDAYALYAQIMLNTFNIDKAERLATEALKRNPDHADALYAHVICGFIKSSGQEQRNRLRKLLNDHPDHIRSTLSLVQFLINDGKTHEAYELARELVVADPANQPLVEMANELRTASHWSMKLLWPLQKWGWAGSIGIWLAAVALLRTDFLSGTPIEPAKPYIAVIFILYVIYSWVWPPILSRLLK